ncbi:branched-chain amino acid ABC transporter permease [Oscillospiraceae bacterium MB08-C2-2]|nr:branched-chain amino acid ABC transporter permease [Oscillospiraceae bacterium MB08-C2-2]
MIRKNLKRQPLILLGLLLILLGVPLVVKSNYYISILVYCLAFAGLGSAWNLIGGYGGQISWCHSGFLAIGAYTAIMIQKYLGISPWLTIGIGVVLSFCLATMIGYGTFKLTGAYFSLATMAFSEILRLLLLYFKGITGGAAGMYAPNKLKPGFGNLMFQTDVPFYYIMLIMLALVALVAVIFEKTKTGQYLRAIKDNETAAQSLGIETFKVKLRAFQLSAVITSVIGVFYGTFLGFIDPASVCGNDVAVKIGLVAIIGGTGTIMGPIMGAFILVPLIEFAGVLFGPRGGSQLLYGLGIILIVLFMPDGLIQLFRQKAWGKKEKAKSGGA